MANAAETTNMPVDWYVIRRVRENQRGSLSAEKVPKALQYPRISTNKSVPVRKIPDIA
jgi:hypothetical protein